MLCPLGAARILHPIYPIFSMPIMIFLLCKIVKLLGSLIIRLRIFLTFFALLETPSVCQDYMSLASFLVPSRF